MSVGPHLTLWMIGHSTRPIDEFIALLQAHTIADLIDVRTVPRSRHNPQMRLTQTWRRWVRPTNGSDGIPEETSDMPTAVTLTAAPTSPMSSGRTPPTSTSNGKWVYVREYGYCWTLTVVVSGWAPYRTGRWVWIGGDYVWISSEPWGWAPYHYGRWAFGVSTGWYWVPPARGSVYWGPDYVGWVHTPTYVAWVPLAPYETYYGYGHHGPHSVNIKQVTINREVTHIYKNVYVNNGVTVVNHDTFLTGRRSEVRVKENPFLISQDQCRKAGD